MWDIEILTNSIRSAIVDQKKDEVVSVRVYAPEQEEEITQMMNSFVSEGLLYDLTSEVKDVDFDGEPTEEPLLYVTAKVA